MNTKSTRTLPGLALALLLTPAAALAQQPTPSPSPQKSAATTAEVKADTKPAAPAPQAAAEEGPYSVVSSIEVGYRGLRVVGDVNKYQSDLNYKAGPRVFDSSFLIEANKGAGGPVDSLLVTSTGWGADPQGHVRFSAEKTKWYRFDGSYRRFKYFRFLNNIANPNYATRPTDPVTGQHGFDTRQAVGDFDVTILPKNERVRFNFGYSPTRYHGPAFTTWHYGGDDFMLFSNLKTRSNDFRVGADWKLGPVDFSLLQGFRRFREESTIDNRYLNLGVNPAATNFLLTSITRTQPVEGSVDFTRFSAHTLVRRRLDITARVVYSDADTDFNWVEDATGRNFNSRITGIPATYNPTATNQTILTLGRWSFAGANSRPSFLGDLGVTWLATDKLRISNTFRGERFTINGGAFYNGLFQITRVTGNQVLAPLTPSGGVYEVTHFRRFQNTIEGDYQFSDAYSVRFGYRYGTRRVRHIFQGNNLASNGAPLLAPSDEEHENHTHTFTGGVRARPVRGWTLAFNAERGTADNIFSRFANYDYVNFKARSRYAVNRNLSFNLALITRDNSNPTEIDGGVSLEDFGVQIKSRVFTSSLDWTANPRLSFSGGYNYNWINSDAVIEYAFLSTQNAAIRGRSEYYVRNHFFHFDVVAQPFRRVSLFATYRVNKDTGQGDRVSNPAGALLISSYPMSYQSPEARVAFRVHNRLDWNVGYSYYNYNESQLASGNFAPGFRPQNYHAHLPYTSLRFYFGRGER